MTLTHIQGPILVHGQTLGVPPIGNYYDTPGPSMFGVGWGLLDTRYIPGWSGDVTNIVPCLYGAGDICIVDQVPSALSATNISAAAVPTAGTPVTLAGASTGITVVPAGGFQLMPTMNTIPAGALMIDGNPALIQQGTLGGGISMYDPRTMVTRCLRFTSVGNDSTGTAAVVGYDWYGQLVHETVTLANATVATSKKALKAVVSITPGGTLSGSNLSVGTSDVFGFQLAGWEFPFVSIYWGTPPAVLITASAGFTAAVSTTPTATTGDVRGTYATQSSPSDGTKKLAIFATPQAWNATATGLWGQVQF